MTHPVRTLSVMVLALAMLFAFTSPAHAANCTLKLQVTGSVANQAFGSALVSIGDVDGDGIPDFAVGAPGMPGLPTSPAPGVYVFSGLDGRPLWLDPGPVSSQFGAALAALGDVDGDGVPDFIVGAPQAVGIGPGGGSPSGEVVVLSGRDGRTVYVDPGPIQSQFGAAVAGGFDLDGDGIPDFAVGAPGADTFAGPGTGAVFVYSGSDGHLLYERDGEATGDRFGASVALRVTADPGPTSRVDLLVGAPGVDVVIPGQDPLADAGAAYEFAAPDGLLIRKLEGEAAGDQFGASVAGLGDVDGDGFRDLVVGAPNSLIAPGQRGGHVYVYSGATGSEIFLHRTTIQGDAFGASTSGIGDLTGDAVADILVGAPGDPAAPSPLPGSVTVLSGGSGLELCRVNGMAGSTERFGLSLAPVGILGDDGFPEWMAGAPNFIDPGPIQSQLGVVRVFDVRRGPPPGRPSFIDWVGVDPGPISIDLTWGSVPSTCAGTDYAVYMGTYERTGQGLANHLPETCSTGGATSISLPMPAIFPPGTALYFIVTAETANEEGSYGLGTLGNDHPPSRQPCQAFLNIPSCGVNDFTISASPGFLSLAQGTSGTNAITTTVASGVAQAVSLVVTGLPAGATATLNPSSVAAGAGSTLTVNALTAAPGMYTLTVTGTEGSMVHSTSVTLTVTSPFHP